jgi:glycosyltransferase involved in cell wall biosynthesis
MTFEEYRRIAHERHFFDPAYVLDQLLARSLPLPGGGQSLFEYFSNEGFRYRISPCEKFSVPDYLGRNPDVARTGIDPLYHYLTQGRGQGREAVAVEPNNAQIKTIAFYLPQYHPIPENDAAWGTGFTEWSNVSRARPLFRGHEQPHLPSELGYYDLRVPEALEAQVELARTHGVSGFCFYYYWFAGRRVLERPLKSFVENPAIDFPFCICWANENWTRTWDGHDNDVIIAQQHEQLSDYKFIYDVLELLASPGYIRVHGKPLLLVYRADLLQNPKETFDLWRQVALLAGLGGLYIVGARFRTFSAAQWGLDALVEFPPHHFPAPPVPKEQLSNLDIVRGFKGTIHDLEEGVERLLEAGPLLADAPVFPTVMPSWDNTPRRGLGATVFRGASEDLFAYWLANAVNRVEQWTDGPKLVFINAWNEWAEGAYLEPSTDHGRKYLEALKAVTDNALQDRNPLARLKKFVQELKSEGLPSFVFVSHDAHWGGGQLLLLQLVETMQKRGDVRCAFILKSDGPLRERFEEIAPTFCANDCATLGWTQERIWNFIARRLRRIPNLVLLTNTIATADIVEIFANEELRVVSYLHELPTSIQMYNAAPAVQSICKFAKRTVAVSNFVRETIHKEFNFPIDDIEVIRVGLRHRTAPIVSREALLEKYGLPTAKHLVIGCGMLHPRKGPDIFVQAARFLCESRHKELFVFVWAGGNQSTQEARLWAQHDAHAFGIADRIFFLGQIEDADAFIANGDVLLLTSREDPYPLVMIEAAEFATPVVCFAEAGGAPELVSLGLGEVVPYLDAKKMSEAVLEILDSPTRKSATCVVAHELRNSMSWDSYVEKFSRRLLSLANQGSIVRKTGRLGAGQKVADDLCVVIPSYNHSQFVEEAIDSVLSQSLRPKEIRIIDDGSTDGSAELLARHASDKLGIFVLCRENRGAHATINEGIRQTTCPMVAILNSDDRYHPLRFETLLPVLRGPQGPSVLFSRIQIIDEQGKAIIGNSWYQRALSALSEQVPFWLALYRRNAMVTTSNLVARRSAVLAAGGFRAFRYSHDIDFLVRALRQQIVVRFVDATLCDYRLHAGNTIRENHVRLGVEDAFCLAESMYADPPDLDDNEKAFLYQALEEKENGAAFAALFELIAEENHAYDYALSFAHPTFALLVSGDAVKGALDFETFNSIVQRRKVLDKSSDATQKGFEGKDILAAESILCLSATKGLD